MAGRRNFAPKRRNLAVLRIGLVEVDHIRLVMPADRAPTSVNANWKPNAAGGFRRSDEYDSWREVASYWLNQNCRAFLPGEFFLFIRVGGGASQADVDNVIKPIVDLLVSTGRIDDDRRKKMRSAASVAVPGNQFVVELGARQHLPAMASRWLEGV